MTPLGKPLCRTLRMVMRQKTMCFPFLRPARVREKRLNTVWKIYVSGPLNGQLPSTRFQSASRQIAKNYMRRKCEGNWFKQQYPLRWIVNAPGRYSSGHALVGASHHHSLWYICAGELQRIPPFISWASGSPFYDACCIKNCSYTPTSLYNGTYRIWGHFVTWQNKVSWCLTKQHASR